MADEMIVCVCAVYLDTWLVGARWHDSRNRERKGGGSWEEKEEM